jgi:hypothetical protein
VRCGLDSCGSGMELSFSCHKFAVVLVLLITVEKDNVGGCLQWHDVHTKFYKNRSIGVW